MKSDSVLWQRSPRVKILQPKRNAKPFLLPHDEWVVDLLLKAQHYRDDIARLLKYYQRFYKKERVLGKRDFKNVLNLVIRHREY